MSGMRAGGRSGGGSRRAVRGRRRPDRSALLAVLLVAVAVALVLVAPAAPRTETPTRAAGVPVRDLLLGCPGSTPGTSWRPEVRLGAAPATGGTGDSVSVLTGPPGGEQLLDVAAGELVEVPLSEEGGVALAVQGDASGVFAVQTGGTDRTLAGVRCRPPAAGWWFSAAGGTLAHSSELVLDNVDPGPAVVDVSVLGPGGPVETPGTRGISVPPGQRVVLPLTELAPQEEDLTVRVTATRGRVVAAVADRFGRRLGVEPGSDWLPPQQGPRRLHRVPVLPRADRHTLVLTNAGDREALVDLQVSTEAGAFTPTGGTQLRVAPDTVVVRDVSGLLGGEAGALLVESSAPVLASVRAETRADAATLAEPAALSGPAAATVPPDVEAAVTLTAGERGGSASVVSYDGTGAEVAAATVDLGTGATSRTALPRRAAYVVVSPVAGDVRGTVTWTAGTGLAAVPLVPLPDEVRRPVVRPAY